MIAPNVFPWIRLALFASFITLAIFLKRIILPPKIYWYFICVITVINLIQFVRGYWSYGAISIVEAKLIIGYYCVYAMIILVVHRRFVEVIEQAIIYASIFIGIYFFYIFFARINVTSYFLGDFLHQGYDVGFKNMRYKIDGVHLSVLTYTVPFLIIKFWHNKPINKINAIGLLLAGMATLISLRRGIILSSFISVLLIMIVINPQKRRYIIKYATLILIFMFMLNIYFTRTGVNSLEYINVIKSSTDFNENRSNLLRKEQAYFLFDRIKENPIFGHGLGANDKRHIRSFENPAHFEIGYLKMIYASGLFLFIINCVFFLWGFKKAISLIKISRHLSNNISPVLAGWIAVIIYNATNPIFSQFSYLFMYFHIFYLINIFKNYDSINVVEYGKIN